MKRFFCIALFLLHLPLRTQNLDSLKQLLRSAKQDTTQLNLYEMICEVCEEKDIMSYAEPGIALADKLLSGQALSKKEKYTILAVKASLYNNMGIATSGTGHANEAIKYYLEGLKIEEELHDKREIVYYNQTSV